METIIRGYLNQDPPHARKLSVQEAAKVTSRTWYTPIHPVEKPNKPGKIRVVNDVAAEYQGESLNSKLDTGPDLTQNLTGLLLRSRNGKIVIAADIEAMYHQVRVPLEDTDSLRFLWKEDMMVDGPPDVYQMLVHIFGAKCSAGCTSYALKKIARDTSAKYDPSVLETALNGFYVDDMLKSVDSEDTAIRLAGGLISMLREGGFRLTKFSCNNTNVLKALPQSEVAGSSSVNLDRERLDRTLGILWDPVKDEFTFSVRIEEKPNTQRGILSTTSSIFDPPGFLGPFTIKARMLLQALWKIIRDWDKLVDDKMKACWETWLAGAKKISSLRLSRQYNHTGKPVSEIQLHVFCDASEQAYGCVAYLLFTHKDGLHSCAFVMSKSRLAPIKVITLPRLELNAARAGARLSRLIVHEIDLPVERIKYWTDSAITLQYIHSSNLRLKVFVANRVAEIN